MTERTSVMRMPELLVFAKAFAVGLVGAEVFRIAYYLGGRLAIKLSGVDGPFIAILVLACALICTAYSLRRGAHEDAARVVRSLRLDLLIAVVVGSWANVLVAPWLQVIHTFFRESDPWWAAVALLMLSLVLLSPLARDYFSSRKEESVQLRFLADDEIKHKDEDVFANEVQAKSFAEAVLASEAHAGLVFGVDGPWGIGKTSFINLAEDHWTSLADRSVVVFRFEPLRYASEPNLAERFIRELSAAIQRQVFVPEFRPVASRYYRMLKGRADVSFLGFKLSLEPSAETIDELLEDIDDVLKRIGRRVIIVIDDLDRLEASAVNNVLFTVRRTFKLSRATYILCYDTENLVGGNDDREKAREFLEKFITVKLSLFVDSTAIKKFLEHDWASEQQTNLTVPSESMVKLASIFSELASMLDGEDATSYMSLIGDMRKIKRFANAVLLMQIERTDLSKTDFNRRDLINLMLLHLNYPGIFRKIYVEETEGRSGIFRIKRNRDQPRFSNSETFHAFLQSKGEIPRFLLEQLFDVDKLQLNAFHSIDEEQQRSRACFNEAQARNLEKYLKLIVRFVIPEPQETFVLYKNAVERVRGGHSVESELESSDLQLRLVGENTHDHFWRLLVNQSHDLTRPVAENAIDTLVNYLPRYSSLGAFDRGLRHRSIYSLALLLDRAGWGEANRHRSSAQPEQVVEIAHRIFGEEMYKGRSLIRSLAAQDRGVIGWHDLMLFRLVCSADRRGQLHNIQSALIVHQDISATTTGELSVLALQGMRRLSQVVFALFKRTYIETERNFLADVDDTPEEKFVGEERASSSSQGEETGQLPRADRIAGARTSVKGFVLYQLSNRMPPTGSGVGCGFYDEMGDRDGNEIARLMNDYVFGVCFNPQLEEDNLCHFLDYCLSNLTTGFFTDEEGFIATKAGLPGGLDPARMAFYWREHRARILERDLANEDRRVVTANYSATYKEYLPEVIAVLDEMSREVPP